MTSHKYARKIRQFKYLAKTINRLLNNHTFHQLSAAQQERMLSKLQQLHDKIKPHLGVLQVRKTLAGAAVFLGLAVGSVNAQFANPVTNPFNLPSNLGASTINLADFDGDGDLDFISTAYDEATYESNINFYENIGTPDFPAFSATPQVNPFGLDLSTVEQGFLFDFDFADLDNDGDLDIMLGNSKIEDYDSYGQLLFFENTGTAQSPAFASPVAEPFGLITTYDSAYPAFSDMDNDGDFDLLVTEYYGNVKYFENAGTPESPAFSAPTTNPFNIFLNENAEIFTLIDLGDLDNDGDYDLLSSGISYYGFTFLYQENGGTAENPQFMSATNGNPFGFTLGAGEVAIPEIADLDDDGDMDVLLNVSNLFSQMSSLRYFENLAIINSTNDFAKTIDLQLSPNPVADLLTINANFEQPLKNLSIEIFDGSGRQIFMENITNQSEILNFQVNTSTYANGLYLVKIQADNQFSTLKFVKE